MSINKKINLAINLNTEKSKGESNKLTLYFLSFAIYCLIGWIYEVFLCFIRGYGFINRGFLFGPYLPVYGFGALLIIVLLFKLKTVPITFAKINFTPLIIFLLIVIITSVVEYFTGYVLELIFNKRWWDYSEDFLNINGRVCPRTSFRFGLGGMVIIYFLQPKIIQLLSKMPSLPQIVLSISILACMLLDMLFKLFGYISTF